MTARPQALPTSIHDVKLLVQSYHPLIVIETVEEERARERLLAVAQELRMPLFGQTRPLSATRHEDIARLRALARDRFVSVR